jgi:TolB protein
LPRISPDQRHVALATIDDASISIYDLSGKSRLRRLTLEGTNTAPVWSPDGTRIVFRSVRDGKIGLFIQNADGSGPAERLTTADEGQDYPTAWSLDDRIAFVREGRIWILSLKERRPAPMPDQPSTSSSAGASLSLSPDGRWATFNISEGRPPGFRVFMRLFPDGAKYPVSRELGQAPVWSPDGREIIYFQPENRTLVSVRIQPPPAFAVSEPSVIPIKPLYQPEGGGRHFDVMSDGRLLVLQPAAQEGQAAPRSAQRITAVLNWGDELARIAPRR